MRPTLVALCCLWPAVALHGQTPPDLRPPAQTYIYNFEATHAVAPASPALNLGATFSIEFWMTLARDTVDPDYMRVFQKEGGPQLDIDRGTHELSYFQATAEPNISSRAQIGVSLIPARWYHVAIVSNNLQVTLYLNGQQQATTAAPAPPAVNTSPWVLSGQVSGKKDGAELCCGFHGSLRQFRIWSRALAPAEITSVATKILTGIEPGLLADWPLDDGRGTAGRDVGPNRLPLTLRPGGTPIWLKAEFVEDPVFQVRKLALPARSIQSPRTIPIDFDSDGDPDLIVCQAPISTTAELPCFAFRNDGKGTFSDVTSRVLGSNPPRFNMPGDSVVADFNRGGRVDVVITKVVDCTTCPGGPVYAGGQSYLLFQTADGRLEDVTATHLPQRLVNTSNIAAADIDGDGDLDFYMGNFIGIGTGPPEIYLNDGQGHFVAGEEGRLPATLRVHPRGWSVSARFIDVNNDGRPDLFVGENDRTNTARDLLLLNDGRGYFQPAPDGALPTRYGGRNWGTVSIQVADLDGDGWQDLINTVNAEGYSEGAVQILLNNRDGSFRDATELIVQPAWERGGFLGSDGLAYVDPCFPADWNGDGFLDLLVHGAGQPSRLFLNTGPARGGRLVDVSDLLPDTAQYFVVADFNGDRQPDVVAWRMDCCNPMYLETWLNVRKFTLTADWIPPAPTGPFFLRGSVLNSATFSAHALTPGELVTIFGRDFGPASLATGTLAGDRYPTELAGTRVLFGGVAAPLIYAALGQVSAVVPFNLVPKSRTDVVIEYQGRRSSPVSIYVDNSAPGLFTLDSSGAGPAAMLNVDPVSGAVSVNSPQNPAPRGGLIVAYLTGAGQTVPPSVDGVVAERAGQLSLPVEASLEWPAYLPVEVLYAGPAPGIVAGVSQVNLRLPDSLSSGAHALYISVGGIWSQSTATVSIR
jgi:uncharacterized protein (TIGR03437 family)